MNERKFNLSNFKKVTYPGIQSNRFMISERGILYDILNNKFVKNHFDKDRYIIYSINGTNYSAHRLVAWEYCPNRDISLVVDHIDCDKQNNYYKNLEWVTSGENTRRAIANGLRNTRGENSSTNKYPEEFVRDVCNIIMKSNTIMEVFYKVTNRDPLTDKFDMMNPKDKSLYTLIYRLHRKEIWPDVVSQYEFPEFAKSRKTFMPNEENNRFTIDQIHKICKLHVDGKTTDEILKGIGIDTESIDPSELKRYQDTCRSITLGRSWANISSQYFESRFKKSGRVIHKFDDEKLCNMLNNNATREEIYKEFNPSNDKLTRRALLKKIHSYMIMKES